jgi:hypothetical protein
VVVSNLLKGNQQRPDYRGVPSVAFTIPPIAKVGLAEDELVGSGVKARTKSEKASDWFTARCVNEGVYGYKIMIDESTDRILGAHLVGPNVDEVINLFGFAIRHGLTAEAMKNTISPIRQVRRMWITCYDPRHLVWSAGIRQSGKPAAALPGCGGRLPAGTAGGLTRPLVIFLISSTSLPRIDPNQFDLHQWSELQ